MTNKNAKLDLIGFGALNMDQLHMVDKIAGPDEESFINGFQESCGGSAANTIIGASRLGLKTGFIGKVASDREGNLLHQNLIQENVDVNGLIISPDGRSGRVMGFVDKKGDRALYVEPGINDEITIDQIDVDYVSKSKIIHLSSFVGNSFNAQEDLLSQIPDDVLVSFDPGRIYAEKGFNVLKKILDRTDILLINEAELKIIMADVTDKMDYNIKSNLNNFDLLSNPDKDSDKSNLIKSFDIFTDMGIDTLVVKMGDKGSFAWDGSQDVFASCFDVECVDTTGAGDSFNAGFLYAKINDFSLDKSCEFGNLVASKCVECRGATNGLPSISSIDLEKYEKN